MEHTITIGYNGCYHYTYDDEDDNRPIDEIIDDAVNECYSETSASGCDWVQLDDGEIEDL
ncbi:MAG: hypothetical protein KBT30_00615 [Clostridiales bacterium]|nr:hypothetical protein [Candidatus Apopatousia equi]